MIIKLVFILTICVCHAQENNVCKTTQDYKTIKTNPNCWYNYIVNSTVPEIIVKSGRPFIEYKVITSDGYKLTIFRIPNTKAVVKKEYPVFLQHGMVTSSANWVSLGEDSLAFQLSDAGYDVWLGNYRGSRYSVEHIILSVNDDKFWDYSVDDVALKDIPAVMKLIADETKLDGNIIYIGHSLGTALGLMYASEYPDEAAKHIKFMVLAGPVHKLSHMRSPIPRFAVNYSDVAWQFVNRFGLLSTLSNGNVTNGFAKSICANRGNVLELCITSLYFIYGYDTGIEADKYPLILDQHPTGSSLKLVKQVTDFIKDHFAKYDYGPRKNVKVYRQEKPPEYDVSKIKIPTLVVYAKNDWHSTKIDTTNLYNDLSEEARYGLHEITENEFNHVDFNFGKHTKRVFVDYVLKVLEELPSI